MEQYVLPGSSLGASVMMICQIHDANTKLDKEFDKKIAAQNNRNPNTLTSTTIRS